MVNSNIIGKDTLDCLSTDYPGIHVKDINVFTPQQFVQYEGKGFVISGQVNLRMLCEFISSIICPDVEGFIIFLPGQHLLKK